MHLRPMKPTDNWKSRIAYFLTVLVTISLGLCSRVFATNLPPIIASHAGDALWAVMMYFGIRMLFVRASLFASSTISLLICFSVEFSQLYQAEWIVNIRDTMFGALILGKGFLAVDLLRYTTGIALACMVDWLLRMGGSTKKKSRR